MPSIGRVHYAELGRLRPADVPARGTVVALASDNVQGKPSPAPRLHLLSPVDFGRQATYDGPTWLDQAILSKWRPDEQMPGLAADLHAALAARGGWLATRNLARVSSTGEVSPIPEMMRTLRQAETERLTRDLSRQLNATYIQTKAGAQISGVYDHAIVTPTGKIAVLRRQDTFTLAPWKPALEPFKGRAVLGMVGPNRVTWVLDRGRGLPGRT